MCLSVCLSVSPCGSHTSSANRRKSMEFWHNVDDDYVVCPAKSKQSRSTVMGSDQGQLTTLFVSESHFVATITCVAVFSVRYDL
jgi:hypothetical protein